MTKLIVHGGAQLAGNLVVDGSKNSALPILAASLLTAGPVQLRRIPEVQDVMTMICLLSSVGAKFTIHEDGLISINSAQVKQTSLLTPIVRTMRASVLLLGPMLSRFGHVDLLLPGGCEIGMRPINLHLEGLEQMGVKFCINSDSLSAQVQGSLQAAHIKLSQVSVGATENLMMAAVLAQGETVIENAAREPEIVDLGNFLQAMGARISGLGTAVITIQGVPKLNGVSYDVVSDRIVAGTYLIAAAMTRGSITLTQINPGHLTAVLEVLERSGAQIDCSTESVYLTMDGRRPQAQDITTAAYPGFPTDLQAQWVALSAVSEGQCVVVEDLFENRFKHIAQLRSMGADLRLEGNYVIVSGKQSLTAAEVYATDLRASVSLVMAGFVAKGMTTIEDVYHIDRGYSRIEESFAALGGICRRVADSEQLVPDVGKQHDVIEDT